MKRLVVSAFAIAFAVFGVACAGEAVETADDSRIDTANPNLRIAIVGAGPSGLTAAHELQALGYRDVTVFEREKQVGGKVRSQPLGAGFVEFGAVFASPDYPVTLALAHEVGIQEDVSSTTRFILDGGVKKTSQEFLASRFSPAQIGAATQRYAALFQTFPQIRDEKLNNLPDELTQNFSSFITAYQIEPVAELARALIIGFGYSFYEDVPAIYMLKILDMLVKAVPAPPELQLPPGTLILVAPTFFTFSEGYQEIWRRLATKMATASEDNPNPITVRLESNVTSIVRANRPGGPVKVTVVSGGVSTTSEFDRVIFSAPLFKAADIIKMSKLEQAFYRVMTSSRYVVSLVTAPGVQGGEAVFVYDNAFLGDLNRVGVWANPNPALPVFQTWQIADRSITEEQLFAELTTDMTTLGGAQAVSPFLPSPPFPPNLKLRVDWPDYFPRVSGAALRAGFFDFVEAVQGFGGIYFTGGSMSFETVETSAAHAQRLVLEQFPDVNGL